VAKVQVGLLGLAKALKYDLDTLAVKADTSSSRGLHMLLQGAPPPSSSSSRSAPLATCCCEHDIVTACSRRCCCCSCSCCCNCSCTLLLVYAVATGRLASFVTSELSCC
jgi:hypothetical protein